MFVFFSILDFLVNVDLRFWFRPFQSSPGNIIKMVALITAMMKGYRVLLDDYSDPRVKGWFLMDSPIPILVILVFYLHFVKSLGPRIMEKREPFTLNGVMVLYNLAQIIFNGVFVTETLRLLWIPGKFNFLCQTVDYSNDPLAIKVAEYVWFFFITRLLDLLDTVFMIMRKKQNQVSFLHIYHHTGMAFGTWNAVKYLAGGQPLFLGAVNAFVHTVMYTYYLLTSIYPKYKESIWWKKHITELQLLQFVVTALHMLVGLLNFNCDYPKFVMALFIPQDVFMIILFWDFYKNTYYRKGAVKEAKKHTNTNEERREESSATDLDSSVQKKDP